MVRLSIVLPLYNCEPYLVEMAEKLCLDGIRRNLPEDSELVIIDDASPLEAQTRALAAAASAWVPVSYHRNARNLGFVRACNEGWRRARGEMVLSMNSDVRLTRGSAERLLSVVASAPDIGMAGPCFSGEYPEGVIQGVGFPPLRAFSEAEFERLERFAEQHSRRREESIPVRYLIGCCAMMRRRLLEDVGFLDEGYGQGYFDDMDYGIRVRGKGWRLVCAPHIFVFHGGLKPNRVIGQWLGAQTMGARPWKARWHMFRNIAYSMWKYGPARFNAETSRQCIGGSD